MISLIVAHDQNRAIGFGNQMPWHLPDDLAYFKKMTLGKPIIMGRKTYESFGSKPLPKREHFIISHHHKSYPYAQVHGVKSLQEALKLNQDAPEVMIIGGGQIYAQALPLADRLYITQVHTQVPKADTFFPAYDLNQWQLEKQIHHPQDDRHPFAFDFLTYRRKP